MNWDAEPKAQLVVEIFDVRVSVRHGSSKGMCFATADCGGRTHECIMRNGMVASKCEQIVSDVICEIFQEVRSVSQTYSAFHLFVNCNITGHDNVDLLFFQAANRSAIFFACHHSQSLFGFLSHVLVLLPFHIFTICGL